LPFLLLSRVEVWSNLVGFFAFICIILMSGTFIHFLASTRVLIAIITATVTGRLKVFNENSTSEDAGFFSDDIKVALGHAQALLLFFLLNAPCPSWIQRRL